MGSLEVGSFKAGADAEAEAGADADAPGPFSVVGVEEEGAGTDTAVSDTAADDDSPALEAGIGTNADGEWVEAIAARFKAKAVATRRRAVKRQTK